MVRRIVLWLSLLLVLVTASSVAQDLRDRLVPVLRIAEERLRQSVMEGGDSLRYPRSTLPDGTWKTVAPRDWTSGFFPGCLWLMFEQTRDPFFEEAADRWTRGLTSIQSYGGTHDVGFIIFSSFGNGNRLKPSEEYRKVILQTAQTLTTRYHPTVGCIKSWDNRKWAYPVIIDNMMNLELLFWASQNGGTREMYDIGVRHAEQTMLNHFRPDGSTYHVLSYDTATGQVLARNTHQGYADESAWARGQAWAVYGFTMTYRYTRDRRFLATAQRAADYFVDHLPADHVPFWDFQAPNIPNEPRDASAGAIAASGLLELSTFAEPDSVRRKYYEAAVSILTALAGPSYVNDGSTVRGVLSHSVGSKPANSEVDVDLIYGDYYFLEALLRYATLTLKD